MQKMTTCPACHAPVSKTAAICPTCGEPLRKGTESLIALLSLIAGATGAYGALTDDRLLMFLGPLLLLMLIAGK